MTRILAIDPGNIESGWCVIDTDTRRPVAFGKDDNRVLRGNLRGGVNMAGVELVVLEMVASYGMPVGKDVFETVLWTGVFTEVVRDYEYDLVYRRDVKLHHCNHPRGNDATIKQALVDRFASGVRNHGKGTKGEPGWFYGFARDVWAAYALAVYAADELVTR